MTQGIEIAPIERPSPEARVCHYDQLAEGLKGRFPDLIPEDGARCVVESEDQDAFGACDVVKYTRYYRVDAVSEHASCD